MESPNYNCQPKIDDDDTERWLNEGGHLAPTDEVSIDATEVLTDEDDTSET